MQKIVNTLCTIGTFAMAVVPLSAVASIARAEEPAVVRILVPDVKLATATDLAAFRRNTDAAAWRLCSSSGPAELSAVASCERAVRSEAYFQLAKLQSQSRAQQIVASR